MTPMMMTWVMLGGRNQQQGSKQQRHYDGKGSSSGCVLHIPFWEGKVEKEGKAMTMNGYLNCLGGQRVAETTVDRRLAQLLDESKKRHRSFSPARKVKPCNLTPSITILPMVFT